MRDCRTGEVVHIPRNWEQDRSSTEPGASSYIVAYSDPQKVRKTQEGFVSDTCCTFRRLFSKSNSTSSIVCTSVERDRQNCPHPQPTPRKYTNTNSFLHMILFVCCCYSWEGGLNLRAFRISIAQLSTTDTDGSLFFIQRFNPLYNICSKIQTHKRFKRTLIYYMTQTHNLQIFRVIPFKLENDT